jgi:hypothetical protein
VSAAGRWRDSRIIALLEALKHPISSQLEAGLSLSVDRTQAAQSVTV